MSLKDKLEVGLRPDAPYRPDNLPDFQQDDPACRDAAQPDDAPDTERAREECESNPPRRQPADPADERPEDQDPWRSGSNED